MRIINLGYFWYKQGKRLSRYQTQKHKLQYLLEDGFDPSQTEVENMFRNGWFQVWNCGNVVMVKKIGKLKKGFNGT